LVEDELVELDVGHPARRLMISTRVARPSRKALRALTNSVATSSCRPHSSRDGCSRISVDVAMFLLGDTGKLAHGLAMAQGRTLLTP
jgi:hypothetical protein